MNQNQIPPITGPSSSTTPTEPAHVISPGLLTTLIVVVLAGAAFFSWNYMQNKKPVVAPNSNPIAVTPKIKKSVTPSVSPSVVSTAGWKTYENTTYGFSLKYPSNYTLSEQSKNIIFKSPSQNNKALSDLNIYLNTSDQEKIDTTKGTLDEIVDGKIKSMSITGQQKITFAKEPAYEFSDNGMISAYAILVKHNQNLLELVFDTNNEDSFVKLKAGLNDIQKEMISTFQFTE